MQKWYYESDDGERSGYIEADDPFAILDDDVTAWPVPDDVEVTASPYMPKEKH